MKSLTVIARLMDYPSAELMDARWEMINFVREEKSLSPEVQESLVAFIDQLCTTDLMDAQEAYVATFDRGRAMSLLLFEHVHGESRDRGQAMVDLMAEYEKAGLHLDARELPDYLPLFLEFLSTRETPEIVQWLQSIAHILALLAERLQQRDSGYASLFDALLGISDTQVDRQELAEKVATEERDDTPEALDKVWEEEMVQFIGDQGSSCGQSDVVRQRREELGRVQTLHVQNLQPTAVNAAGGR